MSDSNALIYANYFLDPGYIYITAEPTRISAVVGSAVAVCVFDHKRKIGGMNLFQYPAAPNDARPTARYGDVSTRTLVRMMLSEGSRHRHLEAQIFGGAFNSSVSPRNIGRENISVARRILARARVRVVSEDVGGEIGRKIVYDTSTNEIAVIRVDRLRRSDWFPYEERR